MPLDATQTTIAKSTASSNPTPTLSKSNCSSSRTSYKLRKLINESEKKSKAIDESQNSSEKISKSLRFPFSTLQIGRKFKRNNFKLNIFSSLKSKTPSQKSVINPNESTEKPNLTLLTIPNEEKLLSRKNELMYKTI